MKYHDSADSDMIALSFNILNLMKINIILKIN